MASPDVSNWVPTTLVLGPGGIKGFLILGALLVFEKAGYLDRIHRFVGVSVGAVISLMLVAGYTVTEIIAEALDTNLFQDISCINLSEIKNNIGLISNANIKDRLITRMEDKFGFVPTLNQLYMATGKCLVSVAMNLDKGQPEYMSYETEPNISSVDAALLSMNIPLIFYKLKYKGCVYIDGAFGDPYPVKKYDDNKTDILGIYITDENPNHHVPVDSNPILYLYKILDCQMTRNRKISKMIASPRCKHLELFTSTIDTIGITVDIQGKTQMVLSGYTAAQKFLSNMSTEDVIVYEGTEKVSLVPGDDIQTPTEEPFDES